MKATPSMRNLLGGKGCNLAEMEILWALDPHQIAVADLIKMALDEFHETAKTTQTGNSLDAFRVRR